MPAHERLKAFLHWRGWNQEACAAALHTYQANVSRLLRDERRPGLALALVIERVTSEPKDDGTTWAAGPLRAEEWVTSETEAA